MSKNYQRSLSGMVQNRAREVHKVPIMNSGLTHILWSWTTATDPFTYAKTTTTTTKNNWYYLSDKQQQQQKKQLVYLSDKS